MLSQYHVTVDIINDLENIKNYEREVKVFVLDILNLIRKFLFITKF